MAIGISGLRTCKLSQGSNFRDSQLEKLSHLHYYKKQTNKQQQQQQQQTEQTTTQ